MTIGNADTERETENNAATTDEVIVRYLLRSAEKYYTIQAEVITEITLSGDTLQAADFETHGLDIAPASDYILQLDSPTIYKWTDADTITDTILTITAKPHPQVIQAACDMSDVSIYGITGATAIHEGINVSYPMMRVWRGQRKKHWKQRWKEACWRHMISLDHQRF